MLAQVNAFRAQYGLVPLLESPLLDQAAQLHSIDQANRATMSHTGSGGTNPGQRIAATGFVARMWAENVAAGYPDVTSVMNGWMNSPGHRANILHPDLREIGMAAVAGANGAIYWTMDLGTQK